MGRKRDYAAEYQRRIKRATAKGLSRSQARGHARPTESTVRGGDKGLEPNMEALSKDLALGQSLTAVAKKYGVSRERARRYLAAHGIARFENRAWIVTDARPRQVPIASNGEQKVVVVSPAEASRAASYANAAKRFVNTNDPAALEEWRGKSVKDIRGKRHTLETDPNALHRLAAADDLPFHETYRIVV